MLTPGLRDDQAIGRAFHPELLDFSVAELIMPRNNPTKMCGISEVPVISYLRNCKVRECINDTNHNYFKPGYAAKVIILNTCSILLSEGPRTPDFRSSARNWLSNNCWKMAHNTNRTA